MVYLQDHIIEKLGVQPNIDPEQEIRVRVDLLKGTIKAAGAKGLVLGISGGQDSALAGKLAQKAIDELNAEHNQNIPNLWENFTPENKYTFHAIMLPYGEQKDIKDAQIVANEFIKANKITTFNIKDTVDAFKTTFDTLGQPLADYHKGNVKARVRMLTQYAYAGQENLLVCGTDNGPENLMGYYSKFGDGAADVIPLYGLTKRQEKEMLKLLGAPEFIYTKAPTADLLDENPGQEDEAELGVTYTELDDYLEGKPVSDEAREIIETQHLKTEHKRQPPITIFDTWWK